MRRSCHSCLIANIHIAYIELGSKADCVVEPITKVPVSRVIEYYHAQDDRRLQQQQRVVRGGEIVKQTNFGEERPLCGRAAGKSAGG